MKSTTFEQAMKKFLCPFIFTGEMKDYVYVSKNFKFTPIHILGKMCLVTGAPIMAIDLTLFLEK